MKFWFGEKPKSEHSSRRSFPALKAELTEETIANVPELELALRAFAQILSEQMGANGIEIHAIEFTTYDNIN